MGKTRAYKHRLDHYYYLARQVGYRSRAAFKLIQLNQLHDFLSNATVCIDLCAAPGGWSQVAAKYMPVGSTIVAIDLVPIKDIPRVHTLQGDITTPKTHAMIRNIIGKEKADVVLNDGAPNVGAAWITDSSNQLELCLASLKVSVEFLKKGGFFVTKCFRSEHFNELLWAFNQLFDEVIQAKPKASRDTSAELFVVCKGYKAPDYVDPKILDPQYVFSDIDLAERRTKEEGITERTSMEYSKCSVDDFIKSSSPNEIINKVNTIEFDEKPLSHAALSNPVTTPEIIELCKDLKVLGKNDKKVLLRWRKQLRKFLIEDKEEAEIQEIGSDEELQNTLIELKDKKRREEKAERKKKEKLREKLLKRLKKNLNKGNIMNDIVEPSRMNQELKEPEWVAEDTSNKTFDEIIEANIEYLAEKEKEEQPKKKKTKRELKEEKKTIPIPHKFVQASTLHQDVEEMDEEEKEAVARRYFMNHQVDDTEDYSEENDEEAAPEPKDEEEAKPQEQEEPPAASSTTEEKKDEFSAKEFDAAAFKLARQLQTKKGREELIDDSFNRNVDFEPNAPKFFKEYLKEYCRKEVPLTKEDVRAWKDHTRQIDELPTKRVMETKLRKRIKMIQKRKAIQEKLDIVAEKEGISEKEKLRTLEKATSKLMREMKPAPVVVVAQKRDGGHPNVPKHNKNAKVKFVDPRMKKDLRAQKKAVERGGPKKDRKKSRYVKRRK